MTHQDQLVQMRVLVVYSRSKAKLNAEKRQTQLDQLPKRLAKIQDCLNQRKYKRREYTLKQNHLALRGNPAKSLVDIELSGEDDALMLTYQINLVALV